MMQRGIGEVSLSRPEKVPTINEKMELRLSNILEKVLAMDGRYRQIIGGLPMTETCRVLRVK
jgi:hypothetical protein